MTRAHTLTSLVYTSAVLDIRFFFFKQETSEKEKKTVPLYSYFTW